MIDNPFADDTGSVRPRLRSFVRREGRITSAQSTALRTLANLYCPDGDSKAGTAAIDTLFSAQGPLHIEIGCGAGENLLSLAQSHPDCRFVGFEVYRPGVGGLLLRLHEAQVSNVRLFMQDAATCIESRFTPSSVDCVYIFFPDPWPKKRHQKRRLVNAEFAERLHNILKPGATVYLATDNDDYARQMLAAFGSDAYRNLDVSGQFSARPTWRPVTRYERRAGRLGNAVYDLAFRKNA